MMYSQICCCSSNNFSMFIIISTSVLVLSLIIPARNAQIDLDILYNNCSQYRNIDSPAPCEKRIRGRFDYPFWVDNRQPSDCGLEEFKLSCDKTDLVVDIGSDNKYLVDEINLRTSVLTLRRYDNPLEKICASSTEISSTILNEKLYNYNLHKTEVLHLFHNCPVDTGSTWIERNFTCSSGDNLIYFFTYNMLSKALKDELSKCQNTTLPVNKMVLQQFMDDPQKPPEYLFESMFEVHYIINKAACDECLLHNSGLCWRGTDSVHNNTCLYPKGNHKNSRVITAVVVSGCSILLLLAFVIFYYWIKTKYGTSLFSPKQSSYSKDVEAFIRQYGSSIPQRFRYSTLKKITNSFKDEIGKGGYGNVYRGRLADGRVVAVKALHSSKGNGEDFVNEVASIGRTSHVNVVTLLGFCYERNKQALIYEFMPNGSLEKFIHGATLLEGQHLGWEKLYGIAIGIAKGLEYLHKGCNTRIVHFDIKPHNILLDEDFCPKISDFGLAKSYSTKESVVSSLLQARGTIGYIAPEVTSRNFGQVSHKSDVYSYGMMILEMVGGRKNVDAEVDHTSEIYYPRWLYKRIQFDDVLDMGSEISKEGNELVRKMVITGLWCIQIHPSQRPSIGKVIEMLEGQISALEIPPRPYLCSVPSSPSNLQTKLAYCSPSGTGSTLSPSLVPQSSHNI